MKKRRLFFWLLAALFLFSVTALADSGPKPDLSVEFTGLEGEEYWVTALSLKGSGPWGTDREYEEYMGSRAVWDAFSSFEAPDGYRFIGCYEDCSEDHVFQWNYYPPEQFKLLVYFPQKDCMLVSGEVYERYAFHSYYAVDLSGAELEENSVQVIGFEAQRSYDYSGELKGLGLRILVTLAAELLLALAFRFRRPLQLLVIVVTNLATQLGLNLALNAILYYQGPGLDSWFYLAVMEVVVAVIEGIVYSLSLARLGKGERQHPWAYSWTANLASFVLGIVLSVAAPRWF